MTGLLVHNGDTSAYADAIVRLFESDALAEDLAKNGKILIKEKANWSKSCAQLEAVLRKAANLSDRKVL